MKRRVVLARVNAAVANGMSASRIGYMTVGDPSFVPKLRGGHNFRPATLWRAYDRLCEIDKPRRVPRLPRKSRT